MLKIKLIKSILTICFITLALLALMISSVFASEDRGRRDYWLNKYGEINESTLTQRANEVFKKVLAASDRRAGIEPELFIINYDGMPWAQSLSDGSIIITKKGLDFCYKNESNRNGDSRLAVVVGHELAHQFNGDFWQYKFLSTSEDTGKGMQAFQDIKELAKNPDMLLAKELQADQYGIIYSTLAGYDSDEIVSDEKNFFLEWTEKETSSENLPDSILSLTKKRTEAVEMRLREVADKMALFDLAVISYDLGRFDDALVLFKRFTSYFPAREAYSNIGTIYLRMAYDAFLQTKTPESFPFALSFGVDAETRAETINVARGFTEKKYEEYRKLAVIAAEYLKKAADYDPYYTLAKNSLGCVYIIEKKYYDAVSTLEEALKLSPESLSVRNNLAVAYIMLGQEIGSRDLKAKAEEILLTVQKKDRTAKNNLHAFMHMEGKSKDIPMISYALDELQDDPVIEFGPAAAYKAGKEIAKNNRMRLIEEIADEGKEVRRVLEAQREKIRVLTEDQRVRLVLYKKASGLHTDIKANNMRQVYISKRGKNGIVLSKDRPPDYFEY